MFSRALEDAREVGQASTLMVALFSASLTCALCGEYAKTNKLADEQVVLADQKDARFWKSFGILLQGWIFGLTGNALKAVQMLTSGISALRSTGANATLPISLSHLATAYAEVGQFGNARRFIGEAIDGDR